MTTAATLWVKLNLDAAEYKKGLEESAKKTDTFQKNMKTLKAGVAGVAAGVAAAGVVLKKAFDFGKEGAGLQTLSDSFSRMEDRLGLQIDLRRELEEAARGTIATSDLEAASMTLLAGASGELESKLANALPRLLEIAKAAQKVNPALGDTTFLFNSIATGVKRAQPLILDNLGLTIKVGEANEIMAQSLGKTVEELTAEEKQMAILNDVMRAGNTLIEQAGGNTATTADSYAQLEAALKNVGDALKKKFTGPALKAVETLVLLLTWNDQVNEGFEDQKKLLEETAGNYDDYALGVITAAEAAGQLTSDQAELLRQSVELGNNFEGTASTFMAFGGQLTEIKTPLQEIASGIGLLSEEQKGFNEAMATTGQGLRDTWMETQNFAEAIEEIPEATEALRGIGSDFNIFADVDLGISGAIDNAIAELEFFLADGGVLVGLFRTAYELIKTGAIDADLGTALFEDMKVEAEALRVDLGKITAEEAAQNIRDSLGISLTDARNKLNEVRASADALDGTAIRIAVLISEQRAELGSGGGGTTRGRRHAGGSVAAGAPFVVGERGPELFVPGKSGTVVPNDALTGGGNAGGLTAEQGDEIISLLAGLGTEITTAIAEES
jgi:hypothetical protein